MFEAPLRISAREFLEKVQYHWDAFDPKLLSTMFCTTQAFTY